MPKIENTSIIKKFRTGKVGDLYMYDAESGMEYATTTLSTSELAKTVDEGTDIYAGRNGDVVYSLEGKTNVKLDITDTFDDMSLEAVKFGGTIKEVGGDTAKHIKFHMPKTYTVEDDSSSKVLKLSMTPISAEEVALYDVKTGKKIVNSKYSVEQNKVTITDETINLGDKLRVTGFKAQTEATDKYSPITSGDTSPTLFAVFEVPVFDEKNTLVQLMQFIFYKAKLDSNVSIKGGAEDQATEAVSSLKILKDPNEDNLGEIVYIDVTKLSV